MNVTILGATGSMGREIAAQLIRSRALGRREILQLACNPGREESRRCAEGILRDLQDAYAEINPELQVVERPGEFIGDIVVVAAGGTLRAGDLGSSRESLRVEAAKICDAYAGPLAESLTRNQIAPIFLIVTNPVEYVVQRFAAALGQFLPEGERFVIGMGAHNDSLRFQWEIAHDLGLVRDRVSALVVGEHGPGMIPLWSTVQIRGMPEREQERCLRRLFARDLEALEVPFDELLARRQKEVERSLREDAGDVFRLVETFRPDFRVALKPVMIHHTNSKTAHATGAAAVSLLQSILRGDPVSPSVQRMVRPPGEPAAPAFPFGVPTSLAEQFRVAGRRLAHDWEWVEREYAPGTFRAERALVEGTRLAEGIAAMRAQAARWAR